MEYSDPTRTVANCVQPVQSDLDNDLIKMFRLLGCVILCVVVNSESLPYRAALGAHSRAPSAIPPINPVSSLYPYVPGRNPLVSGYNNPYYNGGAAVPILTYSNERGIDGSYSYSYTTADGKQAEESGFLKDAYVDNRGDPQGTQVVEGSYAYISPEGTPIQVNYVADENGFRPSGVHIPADGKGVLPLPPVGINDPKSVYDPLYNQYNPFNNRNPYNAYLQHNNPLLNRRPHDPRYPYDPRYNLYSSHRPWGPTKDAKEEPKKETA